MSLLLSIERHLDSVFLRSGQIESRESREFRVQNILDRLEYEGGYVELYGYMKLIVDSDGKYRVFHNTKPVIHGVLSSWYDGYNTNKSEVVIDIAKKLIASQRKFFTIQIFQTSGKVFITAKDSNNNGDIDVWIGVIERLD